MQLWAILRNNGEKFVDFLKPVQKAPLFSKKFPSFLLNRYWVQHTIRFATDIFTKYEIGNFSWSYISIIYWFYLHNHWSGEFRKIHEIQKFRIKVTISNLKKKRILACNFFNLQNWIKVDFSHNVFYWYLRSYNNSLLKFDLYLFYRIGNLHLQLM